MPPPAPETTAPREVLSPSRLNALARELIEGHFPLLWVEGELSNLSRPASGHLYFSLKDAQAQVRCAMFRPRSTWLRFKPADGQRVLARARVSFYEARGEFQLVVEQLEPAGEGELQREFERLKAKLAAEGLFEAARKRALPALPRRIGVLTSPSGAAVRDVVSVFGRRLPMAQVEILPVPVQGADAAERIRAMLQRAGASGRYDVLLLTRGGGSLEDLWSFNDEALARAIATCPVPVVAAIGHEIDFTLADFVADLRAPTPSAAAELLVPSAAELARALVHRLDRARHALQRRLGSAAQRSDQAGLRLRAQRPATRLAVIAARLAAVPGRLAAAARQTPGATAPGPAPARAAPRGHPPATAPGAGAGAPRAPAPCPGTQPARGPGGALAAPGWPRTGAARRRPPGHARTRLRDPARSRGRTRGALGRRACAGRHAAGPARRWRGRSAGACAQAAHAARARLTSARGGAHNPAVNAARRRAAAASGDVGPQSGHIARGCA